ncbi:Transmembrane protein [Halotydeus destructor]|nr:Transmembrane protein [Halotydeus destructor]
MKRTEARNRFSNILNPDGDYDDDEASSKDDSSALSGSSSANSTFKSSSGLSLDTKNKYKKLKNLYDDDGFIDLQFQKPLPRVPWKAIGLASFLFLAGTSAIVFACLSLTGHITFTPTDGPYILLGLGMLMFVPGFYHVRLAYYAFNEYPGYSFDDIPEFE